MATVSHLGFHPRTRKLSFATPHIPASHKMRPKGMLVVAPGAKPQAKNHRFFQMCGSPIRTAKLHATSSTSTAIANYATPSSDMLESTDYTFNYQTLRSGDEMPATRARSVSAQEFLSTEVVCSVNDMPSMGETEEEDVDSFSIRMEDVQLGKVIGEGAFGKVYQAQYCGQRVAVKVLLRQDLSNAVLKEFESEARIMRVLQHPNICRLLGACLRPQQRALILELVARGSLWEVLRTAAPEELTTRRRVQFALDAAQGMKYLHSFNPPILHRDMKSPNLLVEEDLTLKLSDFGLSRVKAQIQTMTGNTGTVQWMAPEVLGNRKYTEKADVFSFAIVLWEIFSQKCPHQGMTQIQAALGVLNHDLRPAVPRDCPRVISRLMRACWIREPNLRPSFIEIVRVLEATLRTLR